MKAELNPHEVIVSGIHVDLTPALKSYAIEKMDRLFDHEDRIVRIRVEIEYDDRKAKSDRFTAKAHVAIHGPDANISVTSDDAYKSIDLLVDKLDRKLGRRSSLHKVKRNHPHEVELGVVLPKVG
jgi:putative sigma-54 modulation protein